MRYSELRLLRWEQVNFVQGAKTVGQSKIDSGTGRVIPLNTRALKVLEFGGSQFPERQSKHFIFPAERYGAAGDTFTPCAYQMDPSTPIARWKETWEGARERARAILKGISRSE